MSKFKEGDIVRFKSSSFGAEELMFGQRDRTYKLFQDQSAYRWHIHSENGHWGFVMLDSLEPVVAARPDLPDAMSSEEEKAECVDVRHSYADAAGAALDDAYNREMDKVIVSAIQSQVGGDHYKKQKLQPLDATFARYGYIGVKAAIHTKVDKYLTRDKDDELEQLEKAHHCLGMLIEYYHKENS